MNCIKCDSSNVTSITNNKLRKLHLLLWHCSDCEEEFVSGWDIDMAIRPDIIEHYKKYEKEIEDYLLKIDKEELK